ncbi:MAG: hypothetical protein HYX68_24485 [Planctomycetes bacterium]|jgi:hypothetical protein|nr:hypothetical protein [Planctomycetota bacterium]
MFRITFNPKVEQRIRGLAEIPKLNQSAQSFWKELSSLVQLIANEALDVGEPKYDYKNVKLQSRLVVGKFIAIQYAVSEEYQFVFVEKVSLSGAHPYPDEYAVILNSKEP